jgi:TM2 domain-containing membrane protein YozV/Tfp pilus assembly major pilin PilA
MTQTSYAPPEVSYFGTDEKICSTCNEVIQKKEKVCPKCGTQQKKRASKAILLLFTFFFGTVGAHRFYLGNYTLGILYLLFFWTGIPRLISLIEFIVFLFTNREKIEENYTAHNIAASVAATIFICFFFVAVVRVAIPAYSDYINKSKVTEAMILFAGAKTDVETYMQDTGQFPSTLEESVITSGAYVASIELNSQEYYIQATMREDESAVSGKTIRWTYIADQNTWVCSTDYPNGIDEKYLPRSCRN